MGRQALLRTTRSFRKHPTRLDQCYKQGTEMPPATTGDGIALTETIEAGYSQPRAISATSCSLLRGISAERVSMKETIVADDTAPAGR